MKKIYLCALLSLIFNVMFAQEKNCSNYVSDEMFFRYTASGYQEVVNNNHSKAINESKKRANISAESELAKMVNSVVTRVIEEMSMEDQAYNYTQSDTTLVSTYKVFKGMNTICQTKTKLVDNVYVTYVTKEISVDCISDMFYFDDEADKAEFKKKLRKRKKN